MRHISGWLLLSAIAMVAFGCSGNAPARPDAPPRQTLSPAADTGPIYDLHEWGVVAIRAGSFEVAAGPGSPPPDMALTIDKPVLTVHPVAPSGSPTAEPFDLMVRVTLPETLQVAEHYPPTDLSPLTWNARVGGRCRGSYPTAVDARCPGGYCEIRELGTYETDDAACLSVNGVRAPLLFYRLWAPAVPPSLPISVEVTGDALIVENRGVVAPVGRLWRIRHVGGVAHASGVAMPARGERVTIPAPTGAADDGWRAMMRVLGERGLTPPEAGAFDRAWGNALFGVAADRARGGDSAPLDDEPPAVDRGRTLDSLTVDVLTDEAMPGVPTMPRDADVLLFWLPDANIDQLAQLHAEPAPRNLRRAFMVRHVVR